MSYEKHAAPTPPASPARPRLLVACLILVLLLLLCTHPIMKLQSLSAAATAAAFSASLLSTTGGASAQPTTSNSTLLPLLLRPLPLGSIKPTGWLRDQLLLSADGLAGHQRSFYPYVAASSWTGGASEYSGLNEGFAYWLNGLVPLAYGVDDARLKDQVGDAVAEVLARQAADGWLGPEVGRARNLWARYPLLLGLVQLVEADGERWEGPVMGAIGRFVELMVGMLRDGSSGYVWREGDTLSVQDTSWGRVRVQDLLIVLQWVWEREDTSEDLRAKLAESMQILIDGSINWADWWQEGVFIKQDLNFLDTETAEGPRFPYEHGVNAGQGLKALAVFRRFTHNDSLVEITRRGVDWTFGYHGAASGAILADERLAGLAPYYGSETCTLVETMYSLSYLYQALGNNSDADRAELIAFNALPAQMSANWWARQYVGQPNQGYSQRLDENPFWNVGPYGQVYGVDTNYPCCTVNHPQGLPKFLSNSFVRLGANDIAHVLLSPATLTAPLATGQIHIHCSTAYPFSDTLHYTVTTTHPSTFHLRVPTWANLSASTLSLNASTPRPLSPHPPTGLHPIPLPPGTSHLTYTLSAPLSPLPRPNATLSIRRGPLLFALSIPSTNISRPATAYNDPSSPLPNAPPRAVDWHLANASAWNIAIDPSTLVFRTTNATELPTQLFAPGAPPVWVEARGCEIGGWGIYRGVMDVPPPRGERRCVGGVKTYRLEPVGAAKLRVLDVPSIDLGAGGGA